MPLYFFCLLNSNLRFKPLILSAFSLFLSKIHLNVVYHLNGNFILFPRVVIFVSTLASYSSTVIFMCPFMMSFRLRFLGVFFFRRFAHCNTYYTLFYSVSLFIYTFFSFRFPIQLLPSATSPYHLFFYFIFEHATLTEKDYQYAFRWA